jgi:hypothetical protein
VKVGHRERGEDRRASRGVRLLLLAGLLAAGAVLWRFATLQPVHGPAAAPETLIERPASAPPEPALPEPSSAPNDNAIVATSSDEADAAGAAAVAASRPARKASEQFDVRGRAIDDRGVPIPRATATLRNWSGPRDSVTLTATADDQGRFQFRDVPTGDWYLTGEADGFIQASEPGTIRGDGHDELLVCLSRPSVVSGLAMGTSRQVAPYTTVHMRLVEAYKGRLPVGAGSATITAVSESAWENGPGHVANVDADGRFTFGKVLPGHYAVVACAPPVNGMDRLRAWVERRNGASEPPRAPEGIVELTLVPGEQRLLELALPASTGVRGHLLSGGPPASGGRIVATQHEPDTGFLRSVECDVGGAWELMDVPVGTYDLLAFADGECGTRRQRVTLERDQVAVVDFTFAGTPVVGQVIDAASRAPVGGVTVSAVPFTPHVPDPTPLQQSALLAFDWRKVAAPGPASSTSDAAGDFLLPRLAPGRYWLVARGDTWVQGTPPDITIEDGGMATELELFVTAAGFLEGTVQYVGPRQGRVTDGIEASLWRPWEVTPVCAATVSNGAFRFQALRPGSYELRLHDGTARSPASRSIRTVEIVARHTVRVDAVFEED